jgi:hypothetical protein
MNAKTYTNEEKASGLAQCFWWFAALLVIHVSTFWGAFLHTTGRNSDDDLMAWIMVGGMVVNLVLSIVFIYKFARLLGTQYVWISWILAANFPLTAVFAYLLLGNKAYGELSALGHRLAVRLSQAGLAILGGLVLIIGCFAFFFQIQDVRNHEQLKKSGQPMNGTLQMVTRHYNELFIPTGYSFDVMYAGRTKTFEADRRQYRENTLPGGKFTQHDIALVYLPDHPEVAELAGTPDSALRGFITASFIIFLGGSVLYAAIKKFPKNGRGKKAPSIAVPPPTTRTLTIDKRR